MYVICIISILPEDNMKKVLAVAFAVCACATTSQELRSGIQSKYVGQPISKAIERFGPPNETKAMPSGGTFYGWDVTRRGQGQQAVLVKGPDGMTPIGTATVPSPSTYTCILAFATDAAGTVLTYRLDGQMGACRAFEG